MKNEVENRIENALFNFYLEADKDIINDSLKNDIQDIDEYYKKRRKLIFLTNATLNKKQNDYLLELVSKFEEAILMNIEKPISILKQLIQSNPTFSLYNSFDKFTKEDIIEIIKDKNLVELIEQLEENERKC